MAKRNAPSTSWVQEQYTKSLFFHAKLHEWGLVEVAHAIEEFDGSTVEWDLPLLSVSEKAWNCVIHRGIAPVRVFAHPAVLRTIPRATTYYRMLAMVSQKSMKSVQLDTEPYESDLRQLEESTAYALARHLNAIISRLIETEAEIDAREFDLWRGMAAGAQAQGAWQNQKGTQYETIIQQLIISHLWATGRVREQTSQHLLLDDGREILFGSDPNIRLLKEHDLQTAVEIKGGIDPAGAYERLGAAIKTLHTCKNKFPECFTILLLRHETLTSGLEERLSQHQQDITRWFTIEAILEDAQTQNEFIQLFLHEQGEFDKGEW